MKNSMLFLVVLAFTSAPAFARNYAEVARERVEELLRMDAPTVHNDSTPTCQRRYQNLYKDGTLNVALGFGYWDNSPGEKVYDQWIANGIRIILTEPCSQGKKVCGFKRSGDTFTKTVNGPDGKPNRFTISITQGSLTADNVVNTTSRRAEQYQKCEAATNKFFGEVSRGSEVVMFIGHARKGGGPDFCPPVRKSDNKTDYPWYQRNRPGFNRLLSSMRSANSAGRQNQIVALYSCMSRDHFLPEMSAQNPGTGYVLTNVNIVTSEAVKSIVSTLDSLIKKNCAQGFQESANLSEGVDIYRMFR